ncbi:MAG: hypothetical protein P8J45_06895 [Phycisphaerales bacterium]|nr:hypothetical protein [Phycisphaerales bacterium]
MSFKLDHAVFFGRTWDECLGMFALKDTDLSGLRILDCPGGPDALVAEGIKRDLDILAVDPQYDMSIDVLAAQGRKEIVETMEQWQQDPGTAWDQEKADEFKRLKLEALNSFISAFGEHPERYVFGSLPELPFEDDSFDLALSGNFLFVYASVERGGLMSNDQLGLDFHLEAVRELVRVASEVRMFPSFAVTGPPRRQEFVEPVMEALRSDGHQVDFVPAQWVEGEFTEFNDLIRIRKAGRSGTQSS